MQLIGDVEKLLEHLLLFPLSHFIVLSPPLVEFHVKCVHFLLLLCDQVIDLDLDAIAAHFEELL